MMVTPPLADLRRMKVVVLGNRKGGVGTTATACQLLFFFALPLELRVLFVDFDHQGNSTRCLSRNQAVAVAKCSSSAILEGIVPILPPGPCVLVPADDALSGLERQPQRHNDFANALAAFIESQRDHFDICIIDTNPNPDIRFAAALIVADFLLSPIELKQEAIDGIGALLNHGRYGVRKVKAVLNPKLDFIGILPNMVESNPFQRANLQQLVERYSSLLIPVERDGVAGYAYIPNRTAIAEAQAAGVPLWMLRQAAAARGTEAGGPLGPVRSSAREAWREIKPSFVAIARRMGIGDGA